MSEVVGPRWEVVVDHTEERHALDAYPIVRTVIQSRLSHAQQVAMPTRQALAAEVEEQCRTLGRELLLVRRCDAMTIETETEQDEVSGAIQVRASGERIVRPETMKPEPEPEPRPRWWRMEVPLWWMLPQVALVGSVGVVVGMVLP